MYSFSWNCSRSSEILLCYSVCTCNKQFGTGGARCCPVFSLWSLNFGVLPKNCVQKGFNYFFGPVHRQFNWYLTPASQPRQSNQGTTKLIKPQATCHLLSWHSQFIRRESEWLLVMLTQRKRTEKLYSPIDDKRWQNYKTDKWHLTNTVFVS